MQDLLFHKQDKMNRRFLNPIASAANGMYSISRMDTSQLFNRSTAVMAKDQVRSMEERLIATKFSFEPFMTSLFGIVTGEDVLSVPAQAQDSLC
jgi:hypothetical protein